MRPDVLERLLTSLQRENAGLNQYCQALERELAEYKRGNENQSAVGGNGSDDKENRDSNTHHEQGHPQVIRGAARGKLAGVSSNAGNDVYKNDALTTSKTDSRSPSAAYNAWRRSRVSGQDAGLFSPPQMDTLKLLTRIAELESANVDMQIELEVRCGFIAAV